jgi:solute carrier family 50 protein (sugar transporter)
MNEIFPIIGVILTNLLGVNILYTYYENRIVEKQEYNEYLFYILFFNSLCWLLYAIITIDSYIFFSVILSLIGSFGFIQILYNKINKKKLIYIEIICTLYFIYFMTIIYFLNFTNYNVKMIIGIVSMLTSITTNISPLLVIKEVIEKNSNELIYLPQALIGTLNLSCWLVYSIIINDIYQLITNSIGLSMCVVQIIVYGYYHKRNTVLPSDILL